MTRNIKAIHILIIVILGFSIYANSLDGKFIGDDSTLIEHNEYLRNWKHIPKFFHENISAGAGLENFPFYRPVLMLTFLFDYSLWKLDVRGYHFTTISIHVLAAISLYACILLLVGNHMTAFFTSIFFLVHPINCEDVAYITGRADSLALVFLLVSFACYIDGIRRNSYYLYPIAILSFILALLSKENSIMFPLLLLAFHYSYRIKPKVKTYSPFALTAVFYFVLRKTIFMNTAPIRAKDLCGILESLPGFFEAITNYFRLLFLPFNLHMSYGTKIFSWADPKVISGCIIVFSLSYLAVKKMKHERIFIFSVLWFFITLLPVSNVVYPCFVYMAERYMYIPAIGFFLFWGKTLSDMYQRKETRNLALTCFIGCVLFYSILTMMKNQTWREPVRFYQREIGFSPFNAGAYYNLGTTYHKDATAAHPIDSYKKYQKAISCYRKAIALDPDYNKAYCNLALAYREIGDNARAIAFARNVIERKPDSALAFNTLAQIYSFNKQEDKAIMFFHRVLELNPDFPQVHNSLAVLYYMRKEYELAGRHYDKAVENGDTIHPLFSKHVRQLRK